MTSIPLYEDRVQTAGAYETSREPVQALIPRGARRILDVGCASGMLGAALRARQDCEVVGIDINPDYASDAGRRLNGFTAVNLENQALVGFEGFGTFDCIVCADVLEHLRDPYTVLAALVRVLRREGQVVISLPNVRHLAVAFHVFVRGTWPRDDVGLFDATHLRWFTEKDMLAMLRNAGLEVVKVDRIYRLLSRGTPWDGAARYLGPAKHFFAYQVLATASLR